MEIPLTSEQERLLEAVAARTHKSATAVAAEAIEAYLNHERWFGEQVAEGQAAARRGELLEHSEVVRQVEQFHQE